MPRVGILRTRAVSGKNTEATYVTLHNTRSQFANRQTKSKKWAADKLIKMNTKECFCKIVTTKMITVLIVFCLSVCASHSNPCRESRQCYTLVVKAL